MIRLIADNNLNAQARTPNHADNPSILAGAIIGQSNIWFKVYRLLLLLPLPLDLQDHIVRSVCQSKYAHLKEITQAAFRLRSLACMSAGICAAPATSFPLALFLFWDVHRLECFQKHNFESLLLSLPSYCALRLLCTLSPCLILGLQIQALTPRNGSKYIHTFLHRLECKGLLLSFTQFRLNKWWAAVSPSPVLCMTCGSSLLASGKA